MSSRPGWLLAFALSTLLAGTAQGHVDYVTEDARSVDPFGFLVSAVSDPLNALLVVGGALVVAASTAGYVRRRPARYDVAEMAEAESCDW